MKRLAAIPLAAIAVAGCTSYPGANRVSGEAYRTPVATIVDQYVEEGYPLGPGTRVFETNYDLDGDGIAEALVYLRGPGLCGTGGCPLLLLDWEGARWNIFQRFSVSQLPVYALEPDDSGWAGLAITTAGGGAPVRLMELRYGPDGYPDNPTVEPARPFTGEPGMLLLEEGEGVGIAEAMTTAR
jgi:hypothetical protein